MQILSPFSWKSCELTPRDRRNQRRFLIWFFTWTVAWVAASIAIKEGWSPAGAPAVATALFPTLLGIAMMLAYWRFIRKADELQRKIHLDALAIGFGIGIVGMLTLHLLGRIGVLSQLDLGDVTAMMMFAYAIGVIIGVRRYA